MTTPGRRVPLAGGVGEDRDLESFERGPAPQGVTPEEAAPRLSVVVPTLDEAGTVGPLLTDLATLRVPYEAVVVDGGSHDDTVAIAEHLGARVLEGPRGRGAQLAAGAAAARGEWLAFLHADVRMGADARHAVERIVAEGTTGHAHAFTFAIGAAGLGYRVLEWGTNVRARTVGLPYGDQGLLVTRSDYDRSGGYPPHPIMEDVALVRRLRRVATLHVLKAPLTVSPRRWQRSGVVRGTLRNWMLLAAYGCGVPPARLVRAYRPATGEHT
jgi:rSAM/selenodomain-associated transferase 2